MFDLNGRIAILTGAARGIGFAAAEKLAENGASVVLGDLNEPLVQEAAGRLKAKGYEALAVRMDVGRNDSIREAIAAAVKAFGGIDIVVNNAGILSALSIEEMTREEWDKVLNVNLGGTFFVIQAALPFLKKSQNPRIINISSLTGRNGGFEGSMCYAASKGGVISITRGMARRLAPFNITVNAVCPGPTETEILKGYTPEAQERQRNVSLLRRLGQPEEIAASICYLASTEAAFVTGAMLDVNGGAYMG
ncbi:MAG TPA: 3-oxoacyl-ACP reductase family protein [Candidatus Methylomirabilis sp.]|jgi:NAD(P)-dependent dehydrogenase (short-subunit alcohol dehydrogenase family)